MSKQFIKERKAIIQGKPYIREFTGFKPVVMKPKLKDDEFGRKRVIGHEISDAEFMIQGLTVESIKARGYQEAFETTITVRIIKENDQGILEKHEHLHVGMLTLEEESLPDDGDAPNWKVVISPRIYVYTINGETVRKADVIKSVFDYGEGDTNLAAREQAATSANVNINQISPALDLSASARLNVAGINIGVSL